MTESLFRRLVAEFFGTFWLVFGGCGPAVLAAKFVKDGTDTGLPFGAISGGHFNPAVTLGLTAARRFGWRDGGLAANGYGAHSPGGYCLTGVLIIEIVLTAVFLYVILGVTDVRAPGASRRWRSA